MNKKEKKRNKLQSSVEGAGGRRGKDKGTHPCLGGSRKASQNDILHCSRKEGGCTQWFLTVESSHLMVLVPQKSGGLADWLQAGKS